VVGSTHYSWAGGSVIWTRDITSDLSRPSIATPALNSASEVRPSSSFWESLSSANCFLMVEIRIPTSFDRSQTSLVP